MQIRIVKASIAALSLFVGFSARKPLRWAGRFDGRNASPSVALRRALRQLDFEFHFFFHAADNLFFDSGNVGLRDAEAYRRLPLGFFCATLEAKAELHYELFAFIEFVD